MGLGTRVELKRRDAAGSVEVELASWISILFWALGSNRSGFQVTGGAISMLRLVTVALGREEGVCK